MKILVPAVFLFAVFAPSTSAQDLASATSNWPLDACTDKSFSIPSWIIQNLTIEGSSKSLSFSIVNRATNSWENLKCEIVQGTCQIEGTEKDSDSQVVLQIRDGIVQVSVNQSWVCDDKRTLQYNETKPLHFTASGATNITLSCDDTGGDSTCKGPRRLINGVLSEPFIIVPDYHGPPGSDTPGCMAPSNSLYWTLFNVNYANNTRSDPWVGPTRGRTLDLDIMNNAGNFLVKCRNIITTNPFDAPFVWSGNCWIDPYKSWQDGPEIGNIWTDIKFDESDYSVSINQTWFCEEPGSLGPYNITATVAKFVVPLDCGIQYENFVCTASGVNMTGGFTSRDPLPPFSLTDPLPTTGGCTIESIYGPNFGINEIYLDNLKNTTDDPQSVNFRFHLRKYHTGQDDVIENTINISRISNSSVAQTWVTSDFLTSGTYKCAWKYDFARNHFTFDYEWLCNDKDAVNQIWFKALASVDLQPQNCTAADPTVSNDYLFCQYGPPEYIEFYPDTVSPGSQTYGGN